MISFMASEEIGLQGLGDYLLGRVMSTSIKFCCACFFFLSVNVKPNRFYSMKVNAAECHARMRQLCANQSRRGGGIEPLHVSMPLELKSSPSASPTHPGNARKLKNLLFERDAQVAYIYVNMYIYIYHIQDSDAIASCFLISPLSIISCADTIACEQKSI